MAPRWRGGADRRPCGRPDPPRDRAQTTIDFMIGAGVFLLIVGFVLGTIPGMIDPFSDSQETTLVADRLATQIAEGMLAEPDRPTVLDETCTYAFFDLSADGSDCPIPFSSSDADLADRVGVQDRYSVNVTVERDVDADGRLHILTTDGDSVGTGFGTRLAIGDPPAGAQSVVIASRTAFIDGKDVRVVVRVW